jgi:hypothetical protein
MNMGKLVEPVRESTSASTAVGTTVVGAVCAVGSGPGWLTVVEAVDVVVRVVVGASVFVVGDETHTTMKPNAINAPHTSFRRRSSRSTKPLFIAMVGTLLCLLG